MDMALLSEKLKAAGVSSRYYRFGSYGNGSGESFLLSPCSSGFEVRYVERGSSSVVASFATENEACEFLLAELTQDTTYLRQNQ